MDESSTTTLQISEDSTINRTSSTSSSSSSSAAAAAVTSADVMPTIPPPSYDATANGSRDVEAGMNSDDVTVTTSSPPDAVAVAAAAAAACRPWADDSFSDKNVRLAFIRKVYLILMAQLLFTVVCICICLFSSTIRELVQESIWTYLAAYLVFVVTFIVLAFIPKVRRRFPANYICLVIFTIAVSFFTAIISSFHDTVIVLVAMAMTAAICLSITIFAVQTKIEFTLRNVMLFTSCMVLVFCALTCFIFFLAGFYYYLSVLFSGIIALIIALILVFDTQRVVGKGSQHLSPEEYIAGALEIYIDIVYMFLLILGMSSD